jgi:undecaprenyl diphosphate synthase
LQEAIEITAPNTGLTLILALSYSGRWDIEQAVKKIAQKVEKGELTASEINTQTIQAHLSTFGIPEPELIIRTSGEFRISNFLLWQLAYTEIYITQTLWPDFRKKDLYEAIASFQQRERRFGKTSEQIQTEKKKNKTFLYTKTNTAYKEDNRDLLSCS